MEDEAGLIVLAAGSSRRYGSDKLVEEFRGKKILQMVLDNMAMTSCFPKIVVVRPGFPIDGFDTGNFRIVLNSDHDLGVSTSIAARLRVLLQYELPGFFLVLGDMPLVKGSDIDFLKEKVMENRDHLISFTFNGVKGFPTYIPVVCFPELLKLRGDSGAYSLVKSGKVPFIGFEGEQRHIMDIDCREDLRGCAEI